MCSLPRPVQVILQTCESMQPLHQRTGTQTVATCMHMLTCMRSMRLDHTVRSHVRARPHMTTMTTPRPLVLRTRSSHNAMCMAQNLTKLSFFVVSGQLHGEHDWAPANTGSRPNPSIPCGTCTWQYRRRLSHVRTTARGGRRAASVLP